MSSEMKKELLTQPIFNIGTLGGVSEGKSTLVKETTGIITPTHSKERERNITINQGFGNMKIWEHNDTKEYITTNSTVLTMDNYTLVNHISFVDCPGHQELIKTTLGALELMHGAIIVIAVDQPLTMKPQLMQHLAAAKLGSIDRIIICMNKIDLVTKEVLMKRKEELDNMLQKYNITPFAIIPTCFNKKIGLNHLIKAMMILFNPSNLINQADSGLFSISRTFDINKPGTNWDDVMGGVIGGTLSSGIINVGDTLEIRPGIISRTKTGTTWQPIIININSIKTDTTDLTCAAQGGLIGLGTDIDPFYCKKNSLVGHVAGKVGHMPNVFNNINMNITIVDMFGFIWEPKVKDNLILKIGTNMCSAKLNEIKNDIYKFELNSPACIPDKCNIIICKEIDKILRVVAMAKIDYLMQ
jgi:translation initiation factor 2 subunit 3